MEPDAKVKTKSISTKTVKTKELLLLPLLNHTSTNCPISFSARHFDYFKNS